MESEIEEKKVVKEKSFEDVLRMIAPGTSLRAALDDLLRARMGALVVFENGVFDKLFERGFKINMKFSSQKLVELAKMDGAIILSKNGKKILHANTLLVPNSEIPTKETGTRHKAAERTARQSETIAIAVSERKNKISIYYKDMHYELERSSEILRRASETLQVLEKQRDIYNNLINDLNLLELKRLATMNDVCEILQRIEIIQRTAEIVKRYLIELGKEGMIVSMRLKELTKNVSRSQEMILKDYFGSGYETSKNLLEKMNFDFLLEISNISRMLFQELHDKPISPRGLRLLGKTNLLERYIDCLIGNFKTLDNILNAGDEELLNFLESESNVKFFREEIYNLREKMVVGKGV